MIAIPTRHGEVRVYRRLIAVETTGKFAPFAPFAALRAAMPGDQSGSAFRLRERLSSAMDCRAKQRWDGRIWLVEA